LIQKGYRDDQIACLGFPVRMNRPEERPNSGRKNLSLLIMAGPGRIKSIDKDIKDLLIADLDIHVVVLNGKDEKHRRKVDRIIAGLRHERTVIENLGFVDDAAYESILNECDIIVSKCGANTLSEAVMMGKIIITSPDLVGQELDNLSYFSERVPIFLIDEKKGIAGILRENTFDQDYLDEYWSLTDGMIPSDGYKRYVDLFYGSE
jgi:UDP-N-acetylglucosamine:LPS N-acetylglucosamine transferase